MLNDTTVESSAEFHCEQKTLLRGQTRQRNRFAALLVEMTARAMAELVYSWQPWFICLFEEMFEL